MKVCQIVPSLEPQYGGPSRSVYQLSSSLARAGHAVDLLATTPAEPEVRQEGNLRVRLFRRTWPRRFCPSRGLRDAVMNSEAAVLHHHALWLRTLHYTHQSVRDRAVFVVSPRGMMSPWAWRHHRTRKAFARRFLHPGAMEAVAGWHATSDAEASDIRALGFDQPVCIAPNGIDEPAKTEWAHARAYWHEVCPSAATRPVALFHSRLHRKKRVLELIDLWLRDGPRDWLLVVVGIPEEYTPGELTRHVRQCAGEERVAVFDGSSAPPPYAIASLFLLPSHNENFGLVVAEALVRGVPVLVTNTTPWEQINREGCGWCVPWPQFPEALRNATRESKSAMRARGIRGREWVQREFSWTESARRLTEFYQTLCS